MALRNAGDTGHDLSGCAIAALEGISLDEGRLQRVELVACCQTLDGGNLAPFHERGEREARFHTLAVHQHRAGAALAEAAAFLRSCKMQMLTESIEERGSRIERESMLDPVHTERDVQRSGICSRLSCGCRRYGSGHELSSYERGAGH